MTTPEICKKFNTWPCSLNMSLNGQESNVLGTCGLAMLNDCLDVLKGKFHSVQRMLIPLHKVQFSEENSRLF
jgi:hypothetical protein